jgi:hypothetical protein
MLTIDVRLTVEEAISLMRALAAKRWTETDAEKRDDLELLRLKLYDSVYQRQPETIKIDQWQSRKSDVQRAHDPQQVHAHQRIRSIGATQAGQTDTAVPPPRRLIA